MASTMRTLFLNPRPLRSLATARPRRAYATIPTKNPNPTVPMEPSREQAMPMGAFYEAILNTPQPIPDVKPEEPATSVKENLRQAAAEAEPESSEAPAPAAKRGRKPKAKTEPAATATASAAPTASPAATQKATAKEAAAKSSVSTPSPDPTRAGEGPSPSSASSSPSSSSSSSSSALEFSSPPVPTPPPTTTSTEDKAKVIFGSRLAGPAERAERLAQIRSRSKLVAGVLVPPKPEEPDNCCMSGCVNCVWDRFRDEMEEWALANTEAARRAAAERAGDGEKKLGADTISAPSTSKQPVSDHIPVSMDDDGGGSETNWEVGTTPDQGPSKIAKDFWDDELYKNVPIGIREFIKQEKRLKEKHMREGTSGG